MQTKKNEQATKKGPAKSGDGERPGPSIAGVVVFRKGPSSVASLNGIPLETWPQPLSDADWELSAGTPGASVEPAFGQVPGKKPASGVVTVEPDGRVWIVEPMDHFGGYVHTFPKGKQDGGLTLRANAIKEGREESGLRVKIVTWLGDYVRDTSKTRYYVCERIGGSPLDFHWETASVKLVPAHGLHEYLNHPNDVKVLADLLTWLAQNKQ